MRKHPVTHRPLKRPPTNAESIAEVPNTHLTSERREALIARANAGEDVYAYGSIDSPTGIINVWDCDTRIPLFPLAQWHWKLTRTVPVMEEAYPTHQWTLTFYDPQGKGDDCIQFVTVTIARRVPDESIETYGARALRVAQMVEGYINLYGDDPTKYQGRHF